MSKFENMEWLFFDMGSTLINEQFCYEHRLKDIAKVANQKYETIYQQTIELYKQNKKGDLELANQYGVKLTWNTEEGISKPDKRIFEIALARSQCEPSHAVMIGDRIDNDIIPAKAMGMKTVWIKQGFGQYWNVKGQEETADWGVNNLTELCSILG